LFHLFNNNNLFVDETTQQKSDFGDEDEVEEGEEEEDEEGDEYVGGVTKKGKLP